MFAAQKRTIALGKGITTTFVGAFILIPYGAFPAVQGPFEFLGRCVDGCILKCVARFPFGFDVLNELDAVMVYGRERSDTCGDRVSRHGDW